jgi:hypothetical protein
MTHDELKALLPLAALDRLEPDEAASLREHLSGCAECEAELREFEHAIAMFALAIDGPVTEDRVLRKLEARLATPPASRPARDRAAARLAEPARREGAPRWVSRLAIAAAVVLAFFGAAVTSRVMELQRLYIERGDKLAYMQSRFTTLEHQAQDSSQRIDALSKVLDERIQLERVLDAPDLELTRLGPLGPAPGAHAVVIVSKSSGSAVLRANGLDAPPPGKTYELWWITKRQGPVQAATFTAQSDKEVLTKVNPPPAGELVVASAVTLEPAGGVLKPTGVMYLKGSPERE